MRQSFVWPVLILFILLRGEPATSAEVSAAEAPTFVAGDEWRFTDGVVLRIEAIEGDLVIATRDVPGSTCSGCRQYRDKNLTVVKVVDKGGTSVNDPSIGLKLLDFPLSIGKSWESHQTLPLVSTGQIVPFENYFKVEDYREVKTKAGTFKAFKISWRQEGKGSYRFSGNATLWYSPEVRAFVKREVHTSRWLPDAELASYTLK